MEADNFDAEATDDDGSCTFYDIYGTPGCMNILACNYNILATIPDNSCEYRGGATATRRTPTATASAIRSSATVPTSAAKARCGTRNLACV